MFVTLQELCDPRRCSLEDAVGIAKKRCAERTSYDLQVSQFLNEHLSSSRVDVEIVDRALEILGEVAPPLRLFSALRTALAHPDPYVRSKSALALGRKVDNLQWLLKLAADADERVRANTVEALWGRPCQNVESVFLTAITDVHHRVAANAAYGLYLLSPERYLEKLDPLIRHPLPAFRAAGAWVLGKIANPEHLTLLKPLLLDKNDVVRHAGFKALAAIRSAKSKAA